MKKKMKEVKINLIENLVKAQKDGVSDIVITVGILAISLVVLMAFNTGIRNTVVPALNNMFTNIRTVFGTFAP